MRTPIWFKIVITLFTLIATSAVGAWFGRAITPDEETAARRINWRSLGIPPEAAVRVVGSYVCDRSLGVVVQSASGKSYLGCPSSWQPWNPDYGEPWQLLACNGDPPSAYGPGFDRLPHPVRDCRLSYSDEWSYAEDVYVVLEDGSVWQWVFTYGLGTILAYAIGGLLFGLAGGIVLSILLWRKGHTPAEVFEPGDPESSGEADSSIWNGIALAGPVEVRQFTYAADYQDYSEAAA